MKMRRNRRKGGKTDWKSIGIGAGTVLVAAVAFVLWMKNSFQFQGNAVFVKPDATGTIKAWSEDSTGQLVMTEKEITDALKGRQLSFTAGETRKIDGVDVVGVFSVESTKRIAWLERSKLTLSKPKTAA